MAKAKSVKQSEPATKSAGITGVNGELVLGALLAELFGTFVLTICLLNSAGNAVIAAITIMVLVMALSRLSDVHLNPAVTFGMWATKQVSTIKAGGYVVAQILGAMLGLIVVTQFINAAPTDATAQAMRVFAAPDLTEQWRPFLAEALGAMILGFGVAAVVMGRKNSHEGGFIIGGALLLGLIVATLGSSAILNPAVALGMSAFHMDNIWTILVFAVAPIIGAVAGTWLYKLLQWDVTGSKELS